MEGNAVEACYRKLQVFKDDQQRIFLNAVCNLFVFPYDVQRKLEMCYFSESQ